MKNKNTFFRKKILFVTALLAVLYTLTGCGSISKQITNVAESTNSTTLSTPSTLIFTHNISNSSITVEAYSSDTKIEIKFPSAPSKVMTIIKDSKNNIVKTEQTGILDCLKKVTIYPLSPYKCAEIKFSPKDDETYSISSTIYYYQNDLIVSKTISSII